MNNALDAKLIEKIIELRKRGIGYKRIGRMLNIGAAAVSRVLVENGMTSHIIMPSSDVVKMIIDKYQSGMSMKQMAKTYHISAARIKNILTLNNIQTTPSAYHRDYLSKINHDYFSKIDTEHKAYWLGFLYADGYNNEKFYQIELTLKEADSYMLEILKQDVNTVYDIFNKDVKLNDKIFKCSRLTLYSKKMSQDLVRLGCVQKKSLVLKFPTEEQVPKHLIHHFMRGYFDGDGCISGSKVILVGTKDFLERYVDIIRNNTDISPAGSWSTTGLASQWQHASKKDLKLIYNFLYNNETICLKRKQEKFLYV